MAQTYDQTDQLAASTSRKWLNTKFADTVFNGLPLFAALNRADAISPVDGSGEVMQEPIITGKSTGTKWMSSGYDTVNLNAQAGLQFALFQPKFITDAAVLDEFTMAKNSGTAKMIDLWQTKIDQVLMTMQDKFNTDAFKDASADPNAITGLEAIVLTTGTYGGIARSGNTFWQSVVDSAAAALTVARIRTMYNSLSKNRERIDLLLTTQTQFEKYEALVEPALRMNNRNDPDLGFPYLTYKDVPILYDDACTSGTMYGLNFKWLKLRPLTGWNFQWSEIMNPTNQYVQTRKVAWMGNMTCNNPRFQGKLSGLT